MPEKNHCHQLVLPGVFEWKFNLNCYKIGSVKQLSAFFSSFFIFQGFFSCKTSYAKLLEKVESGKYG